MRTALRSRALLPMLVLAATAGCGGRTGDDGFGASANDAGLGGFTVVSGGSAGSVGYAGYAGSYGAGGSSGGYAGSFGGSFASGGGTGCGVTLPGQCCATCQQCPPVVCPISSCGPGQQLAMAPGQCCPVCTSTNPCAGVTCEGPMCPPGSFSVTPAGQCCPVCTPPDPCAGVRCGPVPCPPGSPTVTLPGQCCPSCSWPFTIDASVGPCDPNGYAQFLQKEMIALDALSCTTASDCVITLLGNDCTQGCTMTPVNAKSSQALYDALQQFANANCSGCARLGGSCGGGGMSLSCVTGRCQLVAP